MAKTFDELVKRTTTKKTRARAAVRTQELLAELFLSEVRQLTGKSQHQVAEALGIKQPSLSKLENQSDMQISTLQKFVKARGGELEVQAKFPKGDRKARSIRPIATPSGTAQDTTTSAIVTACDWDRIN